MAATVFCPIPKDTKEDDICINPLCRFPMTNHYAFGRARKPDDDKRYEDFVERNKIFLLLAKEKFQEVPV